MDNGEIKDLDTFLNRLNKYYSAVPDGGKISKLRRIRNGMLQGNYGYQKIYDEVTSDMWYGKFPSWSKIRDIVYCNIVKIPLYENEPGKTHMVNGIWKCNDCLGFGGKMIKENKSGQEYSFFHECETCNGQGISLNNNYFDYFLTPEELDNQSEMQAMMGIIHRSNRDKIERRKNVLTEGD